MPVARKLAWVVEIVCGSKILALRMLFMAWRTATVINRYAELLGETVRRRKLLGKQATSTWLMNKAQL
eukprot:3588012-Alexandrium_andersonii.AAC.1